MLQPQKPGLVEMMSESRILGEYLRFRGDTMLSRLSRKVSDQWRPVLLIPGFLASDATLYPLGARLRSLGHRVFYAGIWINADCPAKTLDRIGKRVHEVTSQTGRKLALIGHSLGGIYAREAARRDPELIERAFLLGSPVKHAGSPAPYLRPLIAAMRMMHARCLEGIATPCPECGVDLPHDPPPVPETVIYTRSDGVVPWQSCIEHGPKVELVEVDSSHCGIPLHLKTWDTICERLSAQLPPDSEQAPRRYAKPQRARTRERRLRPVAKSASAGAP